jgi:NAD(P)-dependent dehydrogenase (short-subunit alcohol dehydrogenase family)
MKTIRGKRALVTGAASGIGRAIALALAREGADLYLVDINEPDLQAVAREARSFGSSVTVGVCDLSQSDQITTTVNACLAASSRLDILVNGAGIVQHGPAEDATSEMWNAVMAVNLFAPIQLVRELIPALVKQQESHILNVCSLLGMVPARKLMCYQTSKFALVGFSMALRTELGAQNIGVTALCPGLVDTPMLEAGPGWLKKSVSLGPFSLIVSPEAVARTAIASILGNRAIAVGSVGSRLVWWIYRFSPTLVLWLFRRKPRRRG